MGLRAWRNHSAAGDGAMKSASYKECHCGGDCFALNFNPHEPCWGDVEAADEVEVDDSSVWIHECQGHALCYGNDGGKYTPEPK